MGLVVPRELADRAARWAGLTRREQRDLCRGLRRSGMSYGEIVALVPVPKGTLSGWVSDIELSPDVRDAIAARTSIRGRPRDTQRRRRAQVEEIRGLALLEADRLLSDPLWVSGTALYWAEGDKRSGRQLALTNADPRLLRVFVAWVRQFHGSGSDFVLRLSLHEGVDEQRARAYWTSELGLPNARFHKTYVKPEGTGHRKNHLGHGVCTVRVCKSADAYVKTMVWIDRLGSRLANSGL